MADDVVDLNAKFEQFSKHCPRAEGEVKAMLLEPAGLVNTGDAGGNLTTEVTEI